MNQLTIAGHLGADPEVRFTSSGKKVTTLRVATRSRRGGKDETIWWRVTIWEEQFDKMMPYFKKGSPIVVTGELGKPEIFTDREGRPQVSMNITAFYIGFSPFGRPDQPASEGNQESAAASSASEPAYAGFGEQVAHGQGKSGGSFDEDEIPF